MTPSPRQMLNGQCPVHFLNKRILQPSQASSKQRLSSRKGCSCSLVSVSPPWRGYRPFSGEIGHQHTHTSLMRIQAQQTGSNICTVHNYTPLPQGSCAVVPSCGYLGRLGCPGVHTTPSREFPAVLAPYLSPSLSARPDAVCPSPPRSALLLQPRPQGGRAFIPTE